MERLRDPLPLSPSSANFFHSAHTLRGSARTRVRQTLPPRAWPRAPGLRVRCPPETPSRSRSPQAGDLRARGSPAPYRPCPPAWSLATPPAPQARAALRSPLPRAAEPRAPRPAPRARRGPDRSRLPPAGALAEPPRSGRKRSREQASPALALARRAPCDPQPPARGSPRAARPAPPDKALRARGAPANFGGAGSGIMAAAALPRAGTPSPLLPASAGAPGSPGPGLGARDPNLAVLGPRRTRLTHRR
ncbi:hypothetical protein P7K49_020517 [Saguinus oedipus]|uniref:Basic proline-rich protein-like n=1 Tax=Saguinus oedipus TaxID=9490 RepID=A0ABQ9V187_SAGOE|nr:hypothetical protein P7K49_020517 [Saguinus oedipus]